MNAFDGAIQFVLANEGGLNEDRRDRGGITNFGLSANFLRSFGNRYDFNRNGIVEDDIKNLTRDQAIEIYREHFWLPIYEKVLTQYVCNYIFDMAVSMSPAVAHKIVQRATWACAKQKDYIKDDGIFGDQTLHAVNRSIFIYPVMMSERAGYYRMRAAKEPDQQVFLDGWLARCYRGYRVSGT